MRRNLGASSSASAPAARVSRLRWRDVRIWIGAAIVCACVVAGSRLMAAADNTVGVWVVRTDMGAGSPVGAADLQLEQVRMDSEVLAGYFASDDPLPSEATLTRGMTAGELMPRSALASSATTELVRVPIPVEPSQLPPQVHPGSVVEVFVTGKRAELGLSEVEVVSVQREGSGFSDTGQTQIVVAVDPGLVQRFYSLLAGPDQHVVSVVELPR